MGVSWVLDLPSGDWIGRQGTQIISEMQKNLEALGAVRDGNYSVESYTYVAQKELFLKDQPAEMHICHCSEYPATTFALMGDDPSAPFNTIGNDGNPVLRDNPYLVADRQFDVFFNKLHGAYVSKSQSHTEASGTRYKLVDFSIKIVSVSVAANFKGVLIEVEYCPCTIAHQCRELMLEFIESILPSLAGRLPPQFMVKRFFEMKPVPANVMEYKPVDTIMQYVKYFNEWKKVPNAQQQEQLNFTNSPYYSTEMSQSIL